MYSSGAASIAVLARESPSLIDPYDRSGNFSVQNQISTTAEAQSSLLNTCGDPASKIANGEAAYIGSALDIYLNQISTKPLLTPEVEKLLACDVEVGLTASKTAIEAQASEAAMADAKKRLRYSGSNPNFLEHLNMVTLQGQTAKNKLIESNLRLVVSLAKECINKGRSLQDLIQEGNLELVRSVERYDYTRGYRLNTYATPRIRWALQGALTASGARAIYIPEDAVKATNSMIQLETTLAKTLGRTPTVEELAEDMRVKPQKIRVLQRNMVGSASLDAPVGKSKEAEALGDMATYTVSESTIFREVDLGLLRLSMNSILTKAVETRKIEPRDVAMVRALYGLADGRPWPTQEVAERYAVSRTRVNQIVKKVRETLRTMDDIQALRDFLD
jgi:RNA polymerase primary sigma factor